MVDTCVPGDVVSVSGIVRVMNCEDGNSSTAQMFYLYIDVNSLTVLSGSGTTSVNNQQGTTTSGTKNSNDLGGRSQPGSDKVGKDCLDLSEKDLAGIKRIQAYPQELKLKLLVNSLCPSIFGHEIVKAGLLLTLFGGFEFA